MEKIIEIKNLIKKYKIKNSIFDENTQAINAVNNVSFDIYKGEIVGLVGESGCGKSTLGKCILHLITDFTGSILFNGKEIRTPKEIKEFRKSAQMIFQNPYASLNPRMTIYEILKEPLIVNCIKDKNEIDNRINRVCDLTGIAKSSLCYYPHEFSGGQRQRISIAQAVILNPEFIVADEPVSALDVSIRAQIINLLKDLKEELGLTVLFISHDLSVVRHICTRTSVMYLGEIVETASNEELFTNPLHPYTQALLSSVPEITREEKKDRIILKGDVPSPRELPSGCKFHTRCQNILPECDKKEPDSQNVKCEHIVKCNLYMGYENNKK